MDCAVTDIRHRRGGMIAVFRYLFIKASIATGIGNIACTINDGASRIPQLRTIGFEIEKADVSHRKASKYQNSSDVLLATLHQSRFPSALEIAFNDLKTPMSAFELDNAFMLELQEMMLPRTVSLT